MASIGVTTDLRPSAAPLKLLLLLATASFNSRSMLPLLSSTVVSKPCRALVHRSAKAYGLSASLLRGPAPFPTPSQRFQPCPFCVNHEIMFRTFLKLTNLWPFVPS